MSLQIAANHLASKGRGPDSQLVHMAPTEVAGLQALAKAHGGSLTINPETGLPEAGFLSNILPMVIGAGLAAATGGTSLAMSPAMIGMVTGAGYGLIKGDLKAGLMAGLGAYGGAGMMGSVLGAGADAAAAGAVNQGMTAANTTVPTAADLGAGFQQHMATQGYAPITEGISNAASTGVGAGQYGLGPTTAGPGVMPPVAAPTTQMPSQVAMNQHLGDLATAAKDQFMNNTGFMDQMKGGLGAISQNPSQLMTMKNAGYGLAAAAPMLLQEPKQATYEGDSEQAKYTYSPGRVENPEAGQYASSERQWFQPRYTRVMASGGPVAAMSARNEDLTLLANGGQQFADGGDVSSYTFDPATQKYNKTAFAEQAPSALSQLSHSNQRMYGLMMNGLGGMAPAASDAVAQQLLARQNAANRPSQYTYNPTAQQYVQAMADGGSVDYEFDPVTKQYKPKQAAAMGAVQPIMATTASGGTNPTLDPKVAEFLDRETPAERDARMQNVSNIIGLLTPGGMASAAMQGLGALVGNQPTPGSAPVVAMGSDNGFGGGTGGSNAGVAVESMGTSAGYDGSAVGGGYSDGSDGGYWAHGGAIPAAKGRFLRGPGDGVSDSIPATIGGKQPARLADGEFVVPARIVSELGNGSSEAGARKLYAMMDRVQKARRKTVGKNKVATDSKAEKMLPA